MKFDKNYFVKQSFNPDELEKYRKSVIYYLNIAKTAVEAVVKFHFTYMALIKIGIYLIAKAGYRIKSRPGHHQKIIETLSKLAGNEDILLIGDKMRRGRNLDFYSSDSMITDTEAAQNLKFIEDTFQKLIKTHL